MTFYPPGQSSQDPPQQQGVPSPASSEPPWGAEVSPPSRNPPHPVMWGFTAVLFIGGVVSLFITKPWQSDAAGAAGVPSVSPSPSAGAPSASPTVAPEPSSTEAPEPLPSGVVANGAPFSVEYSDGFGDPVIFEYVIDGVYSSGSCLFVLGTVTPTAEGQEGETIDGFDFPDVFFVVDGVPQQSGGVCETSAVNDAGYEGLSFADLVVGQPLKFYKFVTVEDFTIDDVDYVTFGSADTGGMAMVEARPISLG